MDKKVQELIGKVNKSVTTLKGKGSKKGSLKYDGYSSGSMELNRKLTGRLDIGFVFGRIYEVYGWESSGKTTLGLHLLAETQKAGGIAAIVDAEHAMDAEYAENLGIDLENLLINQPDSGEQGLEIVEELVDNGCNTILVDSVAALVPQAELDGEMGDSNMGVHARLMSQALRKLTAKVAKSKAIILFTNQVRLKIGVMFGNPETVTGGNALKFYASGRLNTTINRGGKETDKDSGEEIGNIMNVKIVKNKVFPPYKRCKVKIDYGLGFNQKFDILNVAESLGLVSEFKSKDGFKKTFKYNGKQKNVSGVTDEFIKKLVSEITKIVESKSEKAGDES